MTTPTEETLRYPLGRFSPREQIWPDDRAALIRIIADTPNELGEAVAGLTEAQLDTPYREGGWTVRQVVHHIADTNTVMYVRFRMVLTEAEPPIQPFDDVPWAELPDARTAPVEDSLILLTGLHARWAALLEQLSDEQYARTGNHPVSGPTRLDRMLEFFAWHCEHHRAHITSLRQRQGW